jgi:hypothetical protein
MSPATTASASTFSGTMAKGNKVSMEIDSNADSTNVLQLFCYFRGLVAVN